MADILNITGFGTGGDGIACRDGAIVHVPLTVPGDIVSAEIDNKGQGRLIEVVQSGPDRVVPPCRHFGICGGCALQHVSADGYQGFKSGHVRGILDRAGVRLPDRIDGVFISAGTRRRANFAARLAGGRVLMGFHERRSSTIRDVPDCLLINDDVRRVMQGVKRFLPSLMTSKDKTDVLVQCIGGQAEIGLTGRIPAGWEAQDALGSAMHELGLARVSLRARDFEPYEPLLTAAPLYARFGDLSVELAPGAFLQPSAEGEAALVDAVRNGVGDARSVADLFCGHGTFTGPLQHQAKVVAYDSAVSAILALRRAGADARCRDLFREPLVAEELSVVDCAVLDPPRAGAKAQSAEIARSRLRRVVYVSCNVQSFAMDAAALQTAGFRLETLTIVDQFVWSPHTELVAVLVRD